MASQDVKETIWSCAITEPFQPEAIQHTALTLYNSEVAYEEGGVQIFGHNREEVLSLEILIQNMMLWTKVFIYEITTKIVDTASLPPLPYLHQTSFLWVSRCSCQFQHFNFLFYRSELKNQNHIDMCKSQDVHRISGQLGWVSQSAHWGQSEENFELEGTGVDCLGDSD